ncbi:MAG: amino acid adenylation domain-containing protein, partial [Cytophagales bacterium]|nr:amino acid adenylation domain-containing protein [Cytophagales bacterium]
EFRYGPSGLQVYLKYNPDLFDRPAMERATGHFSRLLEGALESPETPIGALPLLSPAEAARVEGFAHAGPLRPDVPGVIEGFERQAREAGAREAVVCGGQRLTYGELNGQANRLAALLRQEYGAGPGERVGIMLHRSERTISTLLALLKLGCVYVPIDPEYPTERVNFIVADSRLGRLITDRRAWERHGGLPGTVLLLEDLLARAGAYPGHNPATATRPEDLAYILYTSGSTGRPKGVMIRHGSLAGYAHTCKDYFGLTPGDRVIQQASLAFDVSVEEIFPALCAGSRLVIAPEGGSNAEALGRLIESEKATVLSTTPLVINELRHQAGRLGSLRVLISGGDVLQPAYVAGLPAHVQLYNTYGPTEATVCVTYHEVTHPEETAVIGKPLPNHRVYLLDDRLNPVPVGVAGELCIGGAGLFAGYVNQEAETREAFVQPPAAGGERLYRTGDLGAWGDDGSIRFLGRKDAQVKWRGYRIEPAEVEKCLLRLDAVHGVTVDLRDVGGEPLLVAYLAGQPEAEAGALRRFLGQHLPVYMIPACFVWLDALPVNANGKIDRLRLPDPAVPGGAVARRAEPPATVTEECVLAIWRQVLGEEADVLTDFFEAGGHSLKAARVAARLHETLGVKPAIGDIFDNPTVRQLSAYVLTLRAAAYQAIAPAEPQPHYPLSWPQRRLWVLHQLGGNPAAYNLSWSFTLRGERGGEHFLAALETLVERHESLRTSFTVVNGEPRQRVGAFRPGELPVVRFAGNLPGETDGWEDLLQQAARTPFDLAQEPLFRVLLGPGDAGTRKAGLVLHHIIADGWSMDRLFTELNQLMEGYAQDRPVALPPLRVQYRDYTVWQHGRIAAGALRESQAYWTGRFSDPVPALELPARALPPAAETGAGRTLQFDLEEVLVAQLRELAGRHQTSLFTASLALLKLLLYRYTGQTDLVIGAPVANRHHRDLEHQVGYYLNVLPLRTTFGAGISFAELLGCVKTTVQEAFEHQEYPVDGLLNQLSPGAGAGPSSLFRVLFVLQNFDQPYGAGYRTGDRTGDRSHLQAVTELDNGTSIADLLVELNAFKGAWTLKIRYNADRFEAALVERMAGHWQALVQQVAARPEVPLHACPLLTAAEAEVLLTRFKGGPLPDPPAETCVQWFERVAAAGPGRTALVVDGVPCTYGALNGAADCLAGYLLGIKQVRPGDRVGVMLGRSGRLIVSILAVLKAGAAYLPLDPEYPAARADHLLGDAGATVLLTEAACLSGWQPAEPEVIDWDAHPDGWTHPAGRPAPDPGSLAYVMYTSGSAGRPKGVMVSHAALAHYVRTFTAYYGVHAGTRMVQQSSPAFDVSVEEIFPVLCAGGTLLVLPEGGRDIEKLCALLERERATMLSVTPLVVAELNRRPERLGPLEVLISGGEKLPAAAIDRLVGKVALFNTYGPTESTVCVTYQPVRSPADAALIGRPIPGCTVFILDEHLQLVPVGVTGEICVSGYGLAEGYLGLEAETLRRFVRNPFEPGTRLYRTGDLGRWTEDGAIEFLGRRDAQVKIRGYRVETGEVEKVLAAHPDIREGRVLARPRGEGGADLVAYWVASGPVTPAAVRRWLAARLPDYMIPSTFVPLEAFPRTTNGKTDHAALARLEAGAPAADASESLPTGWVRQLAELWQDLLGRESIRPDDNFFALGGNSIGATQLLGRLREAFGVSLSLRDVFTHPTLRELADVVAKAETEAAARIAPLPAQPSYEVSNAQKRLWVLQQLEEHRGYCIFWACRLTGALDRQVLARCFDALLARHESLRTTFVMEDGTLRQRVHPAEETGFAVDFRDLRGNPVPDARLAALAADEQETPFDLARGPLLRVKLLQLDDARHVLLLSMHHIISDGWSVAVLAGELSTLYRAFRAGEADPLPALPIQYKEYAQFLNARLASGAVARHRQYWLDRFAGPVPVLALPTDFARPARKTVRGGACTAYLEAGRTRSLGRLAESTGTSPFMVLLAALQAQLYRYTGQEDIVIGTPVSGRELGNFEGQVGCFVNTLPLRLAGPGGSSFRALLERVRSVVLEAYDHQVFPFDSLVEALGVDRDLSRSPLFDVMLAMQHTTPKNPLPELDGLRAEPLAVPSVTSKFDLTLSVFEEGEGFRLVLEYNADLFTAERMERFLVHYQRIIDGAIADPDVPLPQLDMLTEGERHQLLNQFNATGLAYRRQTPVPVRIDEQAAATPHRPAVRCGDRVVAYGELRAQADRVAHQLVHGLGVRPGDLVGILMDRSAATVAALLGILKSGAAYVPIDPQYPQHRIAYILRDSAVRVVVTEARYRTNFSGSVACLLADAPGATGPAEPVPAPSYDPGDLAYVIYTSGSTGWPKG